MLAKPNKLFFTGLQNIPYCLLFLTGIELVVSAKLLGVTFCHNLKYNDHVKTFLLFAASDVTYLSVSLLRSLILYFMLLLFHGSFTPYQSEVVSSLLI